MEERRINKLHGCLIEDNRVPELIQKMGSGGGLQPIELSASNDEATGNILIENMTDEIWEQLKTGNYYVKLTRSVDGNSVKTNIFITGYISPQMTGGDMEALTSSCAQLIESSISSSAMILKMKLNPEQENYAYLLLGFEIGYTPNTVGSADGQPGHIMEYLSTEQLNGIGPIYFNSSFYVGIIPIEWQQGNIIEASFSSINSEVLYQNYLQLGYDSPHPITLLLELIIDGVYYSVVVKSNNTSTFTVINKDLSTTVVSCKLTIGSTISLKLEFKAIKDKTDVTESFKQGLTNISLYAL